MNIPIFDHESVLESKAFFIHTFIRKNLKIFGEKNRSRILISIKKDILKRYFVIFHDKNNVKADRVRFQT